MNVEDLKVLVRWGKRGYVALEVTNNNTIVAIWNSSPADQDGAALLWSTSYETSLKPIIKMTSQKIKLLLDRRGNKFHKHMPPQKIKEILTQKA